MPDPFHLSAWLLPLALGFGAGAGFCLLSCALACLVLSSAGCSAVIFVTGRVVCPMFSSLGLASASGSRSRFCFRRRVSAFRPALWLVSFCPARGVVLSYSSQGALFARFFSSLGLASASGSRSRSRCGGGLWVRGGLGVRASFGSAGVSVFVLLRGRLSGLRCCLCLGVKHV